MDELDKKIADWLGHTAKYPNAGAISFSLSLDAGIEHIVPELDFYTMSNWNKKKRPTACVFNGEGKSYLATAKTLALALCLAVEKLIDAEQV